MMAIVKARAPLRISLAGGGTDVSPFCNLYGGSILSGTIDRYAYTTINLLNENSLRFRATDTGLREDLRLGDDISPENGLKLHRAVYLKIMNKFNNGRLIPLEMATYCDAPMGSGLGASSTIVVSMIKAFSELLNFAIDEYEMAKLAYEIERVDCKLDGGHQDQYSASFGGINFMEFKEDSNALVTPLRIKKWVLNELESSTLLFHTGISRKSDEIIKQQTSLIKKNDQISLNSLQEIKREAVIMKEALLTGNLNEVHLSLLRGWENKKKLASQITNEYINEVYEGAIKAGATAGKISGAGGGGFMIFFVPIECRATVANKLASFNGQISNCHFTKDGAQSWTIR